MLYKLLLISLEPRPIRLASRALLASQNGFRSPWFMTDDDVIRRQPMAADSSCEREF